MGGAPDVDTGPSPEEVSLEAERKQRDKELQLRQIQTWKRRSQASVPSLFELSETLG